MSNITDKQTEMGSDLLVNATTADLITEVNNLKTIINFILELLTTRNF
jgi:hypothetical protein